jgi:CarD family transcriptional regulator
MFKIGDRAVYPAQGVGVVENIESREFCGQTHDFYILRIIDNDMTIMVPVGNANQVGLRTLISKDKVETIYNVLEEKQIGSLAIASWSRRQREYNDKIKTGDPIDVAEVLRELYLIKEEKELSYGEKKVLELARRLLVKELALAEGIEEDMVTERLENMVNRFQKERIKNFGSGTNEHSALIIYSRRNYLLINYFQMAVNTIEIVA